MDIIVAKPPMWDEISKVFQIEGKPVIFSWGRKIYNPAAVPIRPELLQHEAVHGERQINGQVNGNAEESIREWWHQYLADAEFRLDEEVRAHRAEYRWLCSDQRLKDRNLREHALRNIAARLSAPLYGGMISYREARHALTVDRYTGVG